MSSSDKLLSRVGRTRWAARVALGALAAGALFSAAPEARAQSDVNPPLPNVMLLVDTSGSMEYKSSSSSFPTCDPTGATPSEKSRWIELLEVLTGSIQNYRCDAVDRSSTAFKNEYSLNGNLPPDYNYVNPYHRPMSGDCTPGPGTLPTNAYDFPPGAIAYHVYNNATQGCSVPFTQTNDGLLDSFETRVRFGLMTFDTSPDPGTGVSGTTPDYATGTAGTWSYFVNQPHRGRPAGCSQLADMEVGARNAAAPPWEGRMVAFGDPSASGSAVLTKNQQIQQILLATRPFGATPIAGLLDDARGFFWNDTSKDPLNSSLDFGPKNDPYVLGGCRKNYIVLLSDGEPNLDLRPYCEGQGPPSGVCPYQDTSEQVAFDLANAPDPNQRIETFVIGFAVSNVTINGTTSVDCKNLTSSDIDPNNPQSLCAQNPGSSELQACCQLSRIAYNGGTTHAYFADDMDELRSAMSAVLSQIATSTTSRTLPVFASSNNVSDAFAGSYRFFSSFSPEPLSLWSGVLERQRYVCQKDPNTNLETPVAQPIDPTKGDDFVANVDSGAGSPRLFYSVSAALATGNNRYSERSIRPALTTDPDGVGSYGGDQYSGQATGFDTATPPAAMSIDSTTCPGMTADQCRDKYMKWLLGLNNGTIYDRCSVPGSATCSLVGDIYHSTPRLVGRPNELLRDESYDIFAQTEAKRPLVLYTSTNDGFLHAFEVAPNDPKGTKIDSEQNNELWAFIPPAVLPAIPSEYPSTHQPLLDGAPVVRDVVANKADPHVFERSQADAAGGKSTWRTVLVQSFGASRGGYFAIDVTDPVPDPTDPTKGPRFLWQLTEDSSGAPLFGTRGATPLITTLYFDPNGGGNPMEIPVAVLPGGAGGAPTGAQCDRKDPNTSHVDPSFQPRTKINCYPAAGIGARSLTIVRLDTGEIIRTFRQSKKDAPAGLANRVTVAPIDSPITGQPVAFPGDTGAIADRIFVGDRDGTLWRVDTSSTDPSKWTMSLFFDAYSGQSFDAGQPIDTPPVLSLDVLGNVTVAFSTGDQDVLSASGNNYIYSLTEKLDKNGSSYDSNVNWFTELTAGERVAGPMTLFNSALYFSSFKPEPPGTNVCGTGSSRVWGVDYIVPEDPTDKSKGGKARLPQNPGTMGSTLVQFLDNSSSLLQSGAEIFGVGVAQLPSCVTENSSLPDPYFGTGTHTSVTSVNPGKFQLVMNTGTTGTAVPGGQSKVLTINLPTPVSSPHIDSWAAITE